MKITGSGQGVTVRLCQFVCVPEAGTEKHQRDTWNLTSLRHLIQTS